MSEHSGREYRIRQLRLMKHILEQYRAGEIELGELVDGLESLNAALWEPTDEWLSKFQPAWGTLEDVYASMRTEGQTRLDDSSVNHVETSISQLDSLIRSEISHE